MHHNVKQEYGFLSIIAMILVVVFALLLAVAVKMSVMSNKNSVDTYLSSQCLNAAKVGVEYGYYQTLKNNNCTSIVLTNITGLEKFRIEVTCSRINKTIAGKNLIVDYWHSIACNEAICGGSNNENYIEREVSSTVTKEI